MLQDGASVFQLNPYEDYFSGSEWEGICGVPELLITQKPSILTVTQAGLLILSPHSDEDIGEYLFTLQVSYADYGQVFEDNFYVEV